MEFGNTQLKHIEHNTDPQSLFDKDFEPKVKKFLL